VILFSDSKEDIARKKQYIHGLHRALEIGKQILERGGSALDAVEAAVKDMEDCTLFNAGKGSVYAEDGCHELDASIMDGRTLGCGAVTCVRRIKNPICLSRKIMEKSKHIMFSGSGAEKFATEIGMELVDNNYFDDEYRAEQWQKAHNKHVVQLDHSDNTKTTIGNNNIKFSDDIKPKGTVGAVALDIHGNLASATSTGGMTNKKIGRVGDSPIIGAGTYANNKTCAISGTGTGEQFMRHVVGHDISALMEYKGISLQQAAEEVVYKKMNPGDGGIIGVSHDGSTAMVFNSTGMYRGMANSLGEYCIGIGKEDITLLPS